MRTLNKDIVINALNCQIERLIENRLDNYFEINRLIEQIDILETPVRSLDLLLYEGGSWLGTARSWIQWNCINGDRVTWGSNDHLDIKTLTVRQFEMMAAEIAAAALNE